MNARIHPVDEVLPLPKLAAYGLQHVLAFYAGAVLVPILVAGGLGLSTEQLIHLINADLFTCGIASIIQSVGLGPKIGVRLPLLQGVTFTAVGPMISIGLAAGGGSAGLASIYGAVLAGGDFQPVAIPPRDDEIRDLAISINRWPRSWASTRPKSAATSGCAR